MRTRLRRATMRELLKAASGIAALASIASPALAQEDAAKADGAGAEIVVTGLKNASGSTVQAAPLAVTAFGSEQLERANFNGISDLTSLVPNANLKSNSTFPGTSTFSIRGMSAYSTIASTTPTVGVFTDGVYQGTPAGAGWSTFDVAGIEVLRGPQGLFFGRNVTGGAVLIRTTEPTEHFSAKLRASLESGPNYTGSAVLSGPLSDSWSLKIAGYHNNDLGYFTNLADTRDAGRSRTSIGRVALAYRNGSVKNVTRFEYGDRQGDGVVTQNNRDTRTPLNSFKVTQDPGLSSGHWAQLFNETTIDVGSGKIVNIAGYRNITSASRADIDGTEEVLYSLYNRVQHRQFSDELRYAGSFGAFDVSFGVFGYTDRLVFVEDRILALGATLRRGGGRQESQTIAEFGNIDFHATDSLTLSLGQRYSVEWKQMDVQPIAATAISPCSLDQCSSYLFSDNKDRWSSFTPRVAVQWQPSRDTNLYGYYTKGFRSGGFNIRNTDGKRPIAYGQEAVNSFEIGLKKRFGQGISANIALFNNSYKNLQRDLQIQDVVVGSRQTTVNAADVRIRGIEGELSAEVTPGVTLQANLGYLDPKFQKILYDLSGNGSIGPEDYALRLPLVSNWTYGASINARREFTFGELSARVAWSHRSDAATIDTNIGFAPSFDNLDASLALRVGENGPTLSVYASNLLNRTDLTYNNPLNLINGSGVLIHPTFAPISKGRVFGISVGYAIP